jgi:hypothetical protein
MKKAFMLCIGVVALAMIASVASADVVLADFETSNPMQQWGNNRSETIVTDYLPEIGMTGNWLELGTWQWWGKMFDPDWADPYTATEVNWNDHSVLEFDAVMFSDVWPSNELHLILDREGGDDPYHIPYKEMTRILDVTDLHDQVVHFAIDYSELGPQVPVPPVWQWFDIDFNFFGGDGGTDNDLIYLDNFKLSGPPLPIPEPTTIVLLAMAGLMGLLYWRKR